MFDFLIFKIDITDFEIFQKQLPKIITFHAIEH